MASHDYQRCDRARDLEPENFLKGSSSLDSDVGENGPIRRPLQYFLHTGEVPDK